MGESIPVKFFYGQKDTHISINGIQRGMKFLNLSNNDLILYPDSSHALIVDKNREKVWDDVYKFLITD